MRWMSDMASVWQVGVHYDPMIAKVITRGPDRQTALDSLHAALSELQVPPCSQCLPT